MTEMEKLEKMLKDAGIPYEVACPSFGEPQIIYPNRKDRVCDAICYLGSYDYDDGLLEIMGLVSEEVGDDVEGYLTAETVFNRIWEHYIETTRKEREYTECALTEAVRAMWKIYKKYNPNGDYLTACIVGDHIHINNAYFDADSSDATHEVNITECVFPSDDGVDE